MEDLFHIYGPRNAPWVERFIKEILQELGIEIITDSIRQVIENVLLRIFPLAPGTPIGLLIAFELSKTTSQMALSSGNIFDSMTDTIEEDGVKQSFEKSLCFTGVISQRKCTQTIFIHGLFSEKPTWREMDKNIYAVPVKNIAQAVALAKKIFFITQPYEFKNEFLAFISNINMYNYIAQKEKIESLLPFLHILALVSCEMNPPSPFTRHGLKKRKVDFLTRSAFEDVLSAILDGSLDQESVSSETIIGALITACKSKTGTSYFDLIQ